MPKKRSDIKTKRDDFKRPNGQGTCFKMSGNRRKPWAARVTSGWAEDSRQLFDYIGFYDTEQECNEALDAHRFSPIVPKVDITLDELYDEWSAVKYPYISRQTADNYRAAWKYFKQYKQAPVKDIRTAHLQGVVDQCYKTGMSESTVKKAKVLCVLLFNYAAENNIIDKNYAEFVDVRKFKFDKAEKERFSDLEIKKLIAAAASDEWAGTVLIMIYSGMRIAEMLGLTRFNVDTAAGVITGGVKTDAGRNRVIPIHPKTIGYITHWYNKGGQALICKEEGRQISTDFYRRKYYYPALEAAGVRLLTPHACRHTFGSLMAAAGVDTVSIQKIIGHADYSTTANIYTHIEVEKLREAINKIV
jgi:site-specific recombinase XerD